MGSGAEWGGVLDVTFGVFGLGLQGCSAFVKLFLGSRIKVELPVWKNKTRNRSAHSHAEAFGSRPFVTCNNMHAAVTRIHLNLAGTCWDYLLVAVMGCVELWLVALRFRV